MSETTVSQTLLEASEALDTAVQALFRAAAASSVSEDEGMQEHQEAGRLADSLVQTAGTLSQLAERLSSSVKCPGSCVDDRPDSGKVPVRMTELRTQLAEDVEACLETLHPRVKTTLPPLSDVPTADLVRHGLRLRKQVDREKELLTRIRGELAARATFEAGHKTVYMKADGAIAKIQRRETLDWDQLALCYARDQIGCEEFDRVFISTIKPISKRELDTWLNSPSTSDAWRELVENAILARNRRSIVSFQEDRGEQD